MMVKTEVKWKIQDECADRPYLETGGLLIGRTLPDGTRFIVRATGPGPRAYRSAFQFNPDWDYWNRCLEQVGPIGLSYVGQWHTHPIGPLEPSPQDLDLMCEVSQMPGLGPVVIGLICGSGRIFRGSWYAHEGHKCEPITVEWV